MSCDDNMCGTGLPGEHIPKPGDPDNAVTLSARQVYGGISVYWSWPTTNPGAVGHTVLYRGINNDFNQVVELAKVGGSIYFDAIHPEHDTEFYYWIRFRTINGTLLDPIGPVSAIAKTFGQQTLETLTGLIDNGVLAQALKTDIAGIGLLGQDLLREINDRIESNAALSAAIEQVNSGMEQALTFVQQEITQRTEGDSALVEMINNYAAISQDSLALAMQQIQVLSDHDSAQAQQISTLFTRTGQNEAAIQTESQTRTTQYNALAQQDSLFTAALNSTNATVQQHEQARVSADQALAQSITGTESRLNGNIATVQTQLQTKIDQTNNIIGALYTAKVEVNGLVGGFGLYNDGTLVEAGFDVDRFWVGRTSDDKIKPFIIDNGIVYIDKARIREADIDTLKIANNAVTNMTSATGVETCSITINAQGHGIPVTIFCSGHAAYGAGGSPINGKASVVVSRDGTAVGNIIFSPFTAGYVPSGQQLDLYMSGVHVDNPPAGTHTYTFSLTTVYDVENAQTGYPIEVTGALLETKR